VSLLGVPFELWSCALFALLALLAGALAQAVFTSKSDVT
jgi:hypothetical protein